MRLWHGETVDPKVEEMEEWRKEKTADWNETRTELNKKRSDKWSKKEQEKWSEMEDRIEETKHHRSNAKEAALRSVLILASYESCHLTFFLLFHTLCDVELQR